MYFSENEGAHFWLSVLNDIRALGVEDIRKKISCSYKILANKLGSAVSIF
jgi:transposase-like protein